MAIRVAIMMSIVSHCREQTTSESGCRRPDKRKVHFASVTLGDRCPSGEVLVITKSFGKSFLPQFEELRGDRHRKQGILASGT